MALMALDEDADEGDDDDGGERTPVENEIDEIHAVERVDGLMTPRSKLDTPHNHEKELQYVSVFYPFHSRFDREDFSLPPAKP